MRISAVTTAETISMIVTLERIHSGRPATSAVIHGWSMTCETGLAAARSGVMRALGSEAVRTRGRHRPAGRPR